MGKEAVVCPWLGSGWQLALSGGQNTEPGARGSGLNHWVTLDKTLFLSGSQFPPLLNEEGDMELSGF